MSSCTTFCDSVRLSCGDRTYRLKYCKVVAYRVEQVLHLSSLQFLMILRRVRLIFAIQLYYCVIVELELLR